MTKPYVEIHTTCGKKDITVLKNKNGQITFHFDEYELLLTDKELDRLFELQESVMGIDLQGE